MAPGNSASWTSRTQMDGGHLIFSGAGYANTVEIQLDPELHASFGRRGRRRLREIQNASRALLKFDRTRGILRVTGSDTAVADVQRQLDCLGGPRKTIGHAVWVELMRTRMSEDATSSAVQRIQQLTNCRVHIERSTSEVRLFGPRPAVAVASQLLEDLQNMCTKQVVDVADTQSLSQAAMAQLAHVHCVTITVEEEHVVITGFEFAVASAFKAFLSYALNTQQEIQETEPSEEVCASITAALAKLQAAQDGGSSAVSTSGSFKAPMEDSDCSTEGLEETKHLEGKSTAMGAAPSTSPQQEAPASESAKCCCPTCGSTNFCVSCGAPNENFQQYYQMKMVPQMPMMAGNMGGQLMMPAPFFSGHGLMPAVCMPTGMMPMAQQPMVQGDNTQVYLMPAQMVQGMQPGMMMCDGSKAPFST